MNSLDFLEKAGISSGPQSHVNPRNSCLTSTLAQPNILKLNNIHITIAYYLLLVPIRSGHRLDVI